MHPHESLVLLSSSSSVLGLGSALGADRRHRSGNDRSERRHAALKSQIVDTLTEQHAGSAAWRGA